LTLQDIGVFERQREKETTAAIVTQLIMVHKDATSWKMLKGKDAVQNSDHSQRRAAQADIKQTEEYGIMK
jgi:hypothetical protein